MQKDYDDIVAAGGQVVAISTDDLSGAERAVSNFNLEFPILYTSKDPSIPYLYGRFNRFGDGLASAAVFIVDTEGTVAWSSIGSNYRHQVKGSDVVKQLEEL